MPKPMPSKQSCLDYSPTRLSETKVPAKTQGVMAIDSFVENAKV
jgi:hypothetical protein